MNEQARDQNPDPPPAEAEATPLDRFAPSRRQLMAGIAAATLGGAGATAASFVAAGAAAQDPTPQDPAGKSPWGYETFKEPTPAPLSLRPGEQVLPAQPRRYTDIKSYHAHIYFDEDTHHKAALLRR